MPWSAFANMKRLKDIVIVLVRYGFHDVAERLDLPGVSDHEAGEAHGGNLGTWSRIRHAMEDLGPTFVKFGQSLSQRPDLLPEPLIFELAKLQDQVTPEPFEQVRQSLDKAFEGRVDELFSHIDETPLASASISQVHRAVRADDGCVVALKIRRHGIVPMVKSDLDLLTALAVRLHENFDELKFYDLPRLVEVTRRTMMREMDLTREGRSLRIARANLDEDSKLVIPGVHLDLTNDGVLTMDLMDGRRLADVKDMSDREAGDLARLGLKSVVVQILRDGFFHADPHPGNLLVMEGGRLCMLDWGMVGRLMAKDRDQLVDFIKAVVERDVEWLTDSLMGFVDHPPDINRRALETDLSDLLESYAALDLSQMDLGGFMTEVMATLRRHNLKVPSSFAVMIKALITAEGTARLVYPELNVVAEVKPLVRSLALERVNPRVLWRKLRSFGRMWGEISGELPRRAMTLTDKLERGEITIGFEHKRLERLILSLEGASNRLSLGIIIASMLIASSMIMTTGFEPRLFGFPALGVIGYMISGALGIWLIVAIIRSRRF